MAASETSGSEGGPRQRLISAAQALFYAEGIRAVGVDRLCAEARVSKRSLYQHFGSKDGVVTAMLDAQDTAIDAVVRAADGRSPRERIVHVFDAANQLAELPGYQGCPFVGAAVELKDREHPASINARDHKLELVTFFAEMAKEAGAHDPDLLAEQLVLVFDGASAFSVVRGGPASAARSAVEALLLAQGVTA